MISTKEKAKELFLTENIIALYDMAKNIISDLEEMTEETDHSKKAFNALYKMLAEQHDNTLELVLLLNNKKE